MAQSWRDWCWQLRLASSLTIGGAIAFFESCALAQSQIVTDSTQGAESSVFIPLDPDSATDEIRGGATRGANLFHSFLEFNVGEGRAAHFLSPNANIQNILVRVTGRNRSEIYGTLATRGSSSPNLFLINPNGIIFGPNARLDIGGSFVASTASSLKLADGAQFNAIESQTPPLLTVSVPIGLQFGENAAEIRVEGQGVGIRENSRIIDTLVGLRVQPEQTLALVGGEVILEGGTLKTAGGRIELGSVAGSSLVRLTPIDKGWTLAYEGVQNFRDIQLSNKAAVDASGAGGGDVQVQGRRVTLSNGSQIEASTLRSEPGGTLTVTASELVKLMGTSSTNLSAVVYPEATGAGGNVTLKTRHLIVQDGAYVYAGTLGLGKGGNLTVTDLQSVELIGSSSSLSTQTQGAGDAGDLTIITRQLSVRDGAVVSTGTLGSGKGGNLAVTASDAVEMVGSSSSLSTQTQGAGDAGDLTITTRQLSVRDGAQISAATLSQGKGGDIQVNASNSVNLFGVSSKGFSSGLFTRTTGRSQGGNITVDTSAFRVADGAVVDARTTAAGSGGNITVKANTLEAVNGGQLLASGFRGSSGRAGNITVNTTDSVTISGSVPTSIKRFIRVGPNISDSDIDENDDPTNSGLFVLSGGAGNAGKLDVTARSIRLDNQGKLTAETALGQGGGIVLQVQDLLLLRHNSNISATAGNRGNGGNIDIDADLIVAVSFENSDITANSFQGEGGTINIRTQGIFGLVQRDLEELTSLLGTDEPNELNPARLPSSDITAISQTNPSLTGQVTINTPDIDPSRGLVALPAKLVNGSELIASGCPAGVRQGQSKFVITGRGGLPDNPSEALSSDAIEVDLVTLDPKVENRSSPVVSTNYTAPEPAPIVEAQGWVIGDNGEVVLTAYAPTITRHNSWQRPPKCHTPQNSS